MLLFGCEVAVEGMYGCVAERVVEQFGAAHYLALAWQKGKYVAFVLAMGGGNRGCYGLGNVSGRMLL